MRAAHPTDAGAVGAILSEFIDDTDWMPRIHTRAEDLAHAGTLIDRGWVTVAEVDGAVAAFLARDRATIHALYVTAVRQNRGLGKALLDAAKSEAPALQLWTFQSNNGAIRFYRREGFAEVERTDGRGNDEGLPDIRFHWRKEIAA
nr:GNAT family N-acetyltransferase [Thalassococcus arenae]